MKDKNVMLDIGTGDGQSLDAIGMMKDVSFILVEPNAMKCKRLIARLGLHRYHRDPRSVINVMPQLRKGLLKYHVLNCSFQEVMNDEPTLKNLRYVVSYCTACFSAQFFMESLEKISQLGINVIGCCYLYDGIESGSSIINQYDLRMSRIDAHTAEIKWGSDKIYSEPSIESNDIPDSLAKIQAINLIGSPSDDYDGLIKYVCSHVWILRSR
jgi:hypothetical protein